MRKLLLTLVLLFGIPILGWTQPFTSHKSVALDDVYAQWDEITKAYDPGMSVLRPAQKLRFEATYLAGPRPCDTNSLLAAFNVMRMADVLKQLRVGHCIRLSSPKGRVLFAWIQDILIPGLEADAPLNGRVEIYADMVAYAVATDRSRNMPYLIVGRFEPLNGSQPQLQTSTAP